MVCAEGRGVSIVATVGVCSLKLEEGKRGRGGWAVDFSPKKVRGRVARRGRIVFRHFSPIAERW